MSANSIQKELFKKVAKWANPHLTKLMGSNRSQPSDWRENINEAPPIVPFVKDFNSDINLIRLNDVKHQRIKDLRRPYRILCLDGGGVRGALTTVILRRICKHYPNFLDEVDFICGTSAGGLIGLLLSAGYSAQQCDEIYSFAAPHIFGYNPWRILNPTKSKYSDKAKQELFQHYFGERTMVDLKKTASVIAFRLDGRKSHTHSFFHKEGWRPAVFSNMPRSAGLVEPDSQLKVWDAAMRTSAAPTFFPVFRGYIDGGIVANNPSIIALSKAMAHYPHLTPKNIAVLSIGAGYFPRHTNVFHNLDDAPMDIDGQVSYGRSPLHHADWGIRQWMPFLLDLLLDGDSVTIDMVMHYLLGGDKLYHRIDPKLPRWVGLDDVSGMKELQDFGNSLDLSATYRFIDNNFLYDDSKFDNEVHNTLDNASNYHDAWAQSVKQ